MSQQEVLDILKASSRPMTSIEIRDVGWPRGGRERITAIGYSLNRLEDWGSVRRVGEVPARGGNTCILWEAV